MEKIVNFDKQGRIYIPERLRKMIQHKTLVISGSSEEICLKPLEEGPVLALGKLGKGKLKKSIKQLKKEARKEVEKSVVKKIRRY